ncbi:SDR family NAD(P)-dependent oxidoreductase [Brevibacterium sp. 50QC2O2]|uniref:SDR family NAD(P)-dependent oxidoreductase n=1 Tax=Brevibacterium sp. 50QC2O2 TaxID=2968459 RepID=UPI00211C0EE4|nr:SDR family NAD(P)-dependent oxidoreductase [Brevibacterium sp. 50QC2O2]
MDLQGRTAVITGGSSGIGLEIAHGLAAAGARIVLPVRNAAKGDLASAAIRDRLKGGPVDVKTEALDLARLDTVHALARRLASGPVDVLVLNAGIVTLGEHGRRLTPDGFELNFQTNFLGHAALLLDLLPTLRRCGTRVIVQCSIAAARGHLDRADPHGRQPFHAYAASKLALGLFGMELQRRVGTPGSAVRDGASCGAGRAGSAGRAGGAEDAGTGRPGVSVRLCHPGITPGSAIAPAIRAMVPDGLVDWASAHLGNTPAEAAQTALAALVWGAGPEAGAVSSTVSGPGSRTSRAEAPDSCLASRAALARGAAPGEPPMFAPRGPLQLAGPPRIRRPFATLRQASDAARLWGWAQTLLENIDH